MNRYGSAADTQSMKKQAVLEKLRENGFRITKQRELILDVVLEDSWTSSKEIYACVRKKDSTVGFATVYRMVNVLEEIGVIQKGIFCRIGENAF